MKALIEVFTSPTCPHCPPAKALVEQIGKERDDVEVKIQSLTEDDAIKRSKLFEIMSVPTIIITSENNPQPIGLKGLPPKRGLEKAINISLGKDKFKEEKKEGFLKRLFS